MKDYRTPASKVRGLGPSGRAVGHWKAHRIAAVAMFFLVPAFVWMLAMSGAPDPMATRAFLSSPAGIIVTLLTLTAVFAHMRTGMIEVIEDYIHKKSTKTVLLLLNTYIPAGLWLVTVFALLKLAL